MSNQYEQYEKYRLKGDFSELSSWHFVEPYLKDLKVLDIGCSDGLYLSKFTSDSVGIEQMEGLGSYAREKGLNVITGNVNEVIARIPDNEFQGVLFSHVMEHVDCPIVILKEINRLLSDNGVLVLGLPIERNIFRDLLRMDYFAGTHIYAFSIRNAEKLLNDTGYSVEKVFFHLPKCRSRYGRIIEKIWNYIKWPFREYFSMAYWIVAVKNG